MKAEELNNNYDSIIMTKVIKVLGLSKIQVEEKLHNVICSDSKVEFELYVEEISIVVKLTAKAASKNEALEYISELEEKIKKVLGENVYTTNNEEIEEVTAKILIEKHLTVSTAESCTGGMVAARLINYPGISKVFLEGIITYSNEAKHKRLSVKQETLNKYGAVSRETAYEMADGMCRNSGTDISIVTTGIAGPGGGTDKKPVGLVYIGVCIKGDIYIEKHIFKGNRSSVRMQTTITAIDMLRRILMKI